MHEHPGHIALRREVLIVHRAEHTILFRARGFRAVRVGSTASLLLPPLRQGTQWSEMHRLLQERYPDEPDVALELDRFLRRLEAANLLSSAEGELAPPDRWRRLELLDLDPLAKSLARGLAVIPRRLVNLVPITLTFLALVAVMIALPRVTGLGYRGMVIAATNGWGIMFVLLVIVPLHELAHAVACRAAGVPVSGAGLLLHGGMIPGPFVDTSMIYAITDRWKRFRVPIAGPLVDLWAAGAAASLSLYRAAAPIDGPLATIMILSIVCFFMDVNPLLPTDGSRAIEALLDDELARRAAFARQGATMSTQRAIRIYRLTCVLYVCMIVSLAVIVWMESRR